MIEDEHLPQVKETTQSTYKRQVL